MPQYNPRQLGYTQFVRSTTPAPSTDFDLLDGSSRSSANEPCSDYECGRCYSELRG